MTKKPQKKKPQKKVRVFSFNVLRLFPPKDEFGVHLLLLMAAFNDIARVADWMKSHHNPEPTDPIAKEIAQGRLSMQVRLVIGFLHEALIVLGNIEKLKEFHEIKSQLDPKGQDALKYLKSSKSGSVNPRFKDIRDKATFHYLHRSFSKALRAFKKQWGENLSSKIIYRGNSSERQVYYPLPDRLRDAIAFGIDIQETRKVLREVTEVQKTLVIFLENLLRVYLEKRGMVDELREDNSF